MQFINSVLFLCQSELVEDFIFDSTSTGSV